MGSTTWTSLTKADLLATETNNEPLIWHYFPGWPASYLVAGRLHWTASIMEGTVFCSYLNRYLFWIWICLPCNQWFCQNYHLWTYKMPILHTPLWYFNIALFVIKELTSQYISMAMGPCFWNVVVLPCFPTILKQLAWENTGMAFWKFSYSTY